MKNLLITNSLWNLYNFRLKLVKELSKKGNLTIYCDKKNINLINQKIFLEKNIEIKNLNYSSKTSNIFSNLKLIVQFYYILKIEKPDNLFTFTLKPNLYCGFFSYIFGISFFPTISGLGTAYNKGGILLSFITYLIRFSFRFSKKIFVHNKSEKKFLNKIGFSNDKIIQVNGSGINLKKFTKVEINLKTSEKFLFLGRLIKDKGVYELIEAFKLYNHKYKTKLELTMAVITDADNISSIHPNNLRLKLKGTNIKILKNFKFTNRLFKLHGCLILPSYSEGMSRSIMEAASCGLPIICSNINGCKEMVVNGKNGFLVKIKSPKSICTALKKFIDLSYSEKKKFGYNSRVLMRNNNFEDKYVISHYLNVL